MNYFIYNSYEKHSREFDKKGLEGYEIFDWATEPDKVEAFFKTGLPSPSSFPHVILDREDGNISVVFSPKDTQDIETKMEDYVLPKPVIVSIEELSKRAASDLNISDETYIMIMAKLERAPFIESKLNEVLVLLGEKGIESKEDSPSSELKP